MAYLMCVCAAELRGARCCSYQAHLSNGDSNEGSDGGRDGGSDGGSNAGGNAGGNTGSNTGSNAHSRCQRWSDHQTNSTDAPPVTPPPVAPPPVAPPPVAPPPVAPPPLAPPPVAPPYVRMHAVYAHDPDIAILSWICSFVQAMAVVAVATWAAGHGECARARVIHTASRSVATTSTSRALACFRLRRSAARRFAEMFAQRSADCSSDLWPAWLGLALARHWPGTAWRTLSTEWCTASYNLNVRRQ